MNVRLRALVLSLPLLLGACEWFTDFKRQPSLWTWEPVKDTLTPSRGNPQMSVPTTGTFMAGFQVSYTAMPDSLAGIRNPTPISDASLANGRKYFQINCSVCHGPAAQGDGPATKFGMPGINLTTDLTKSRSDGYIYGMIRNGRGMMPTYNRIEEMDRWDVVNYVRGLQGLAGHPVPTGALAAPGVTGSAVPGYTRMGPTHPAPFYNQWKRSPASADSSPAVKVGDYSAATTSADSIARDTVGKRRLQPSLPATPADTAKRDSVRRGGTR